MPRPRTTLRQLSYFVALADTGSFTRAAEQMGVSQPSLSQQIRALEAIIGAPLFERGTQAILTCWGAICSTAHAASCSMSTIWKRSAPPPPIP